MTEPIRKAKSKTVKIKRSHELQALERIFETFKVKGIKDGRQLHFYIKRFLGYDIPSESVCANHCAPFDFVSDMFFEQVRNSICFANRTGGKTLNVAILNHLDLEFKKGCTISSAGAVVKQAERCYKYLKDMYSKNWFIDNFTTLNRARLELKNGSELGLIPATYNGFNCPHTHKLRLDEVELMDNWNLVEQAKSIPKSGEGILAQMCFTSTRKFGSGVFQRMLNEAKKKKMKIYKWCIWETCERCPYSCKKCDVWERCQGKAKRSKGWYPIDDAIDKMVNLDKETWETEWLNLKPKGEDMIFQQYMKRVKISKEQLKDLAPENFSGWYIISGIDWGANTENPFVYLKYAVKPDFTAYVQFFEYYYTNTTPRTIRGHAEEIEKTPNYSKDELMFSDGSRKQERIDLTSALGRDFEVGPVIGVSGEVKGGIEVVKGLMEHRLGAPTLYIVEDDCPNTIREMEHYSWLKKADGTVSGTPIKKRDHCPDAKRYALVGFKQLLEQYKEPDDEELDFVDVGADIRSI